MLFASTRLTLTRELGTEHFRETFLVTTAEELSAKGFERHDAHEQLEAPLTEEERSLGEVKRAEAEVGAGTAARELSMTKGMKMRVQERVEERLRELGREGGASIVQLVKSYPSLLVV